MKEQRPCMVCGEPMQATRRHAMFCDEACRKFYTRWRGMRRDVLDRRIEQVRLDLRRLERMQILSVRAADNVLSSTPKSEATARTGI